MDKNDLIKQLNDLGNVESHKFKKVSYFNAARIIDKIDNNDFEVKNNFKDIKGIGDAINKKILEFKETGYINKWKKLKEEGIIK